jgi:hypothetical protein
MASIISMPYMQLGFISLLTGDREGALRSYVESLDAAIETEEAGMILAALEGIAFAVAGSDPESALRIHGATRVLRELRGTHLSRPDARAYEALFSEIERRVGREPLESELSIGARLSLNEAIELARRVSASVAPSESSGYASGEQHAGSR